SGSFVLPREAAAAFQDSSDVAYGLVHAAIDDDGVESLGADPLLGGGLIEPAGDRLRGFAAARFQAPALLLAARRLHEHEQRLGQLLLDGQRALHVDLEHDVVPGRELAAYVVERRSLQVAVHLEPFEEATGLAQRLEFLAAHEVVVDALALPRAWRACRPRHRPVQVGVRLAEAQSDRALPRARRAGENEE